MKLILGKTPTPPPTSWFKQLEDALAEHPDEWVGVSVYDAPWEFVIDNDVYFVRYKPGHPAATLPQDEPAAVEAPVAPTKAPQVSLSLAEIVRINVEQHRSTGDPAPEFVSWPDNPPPPTIGHFDETPEYVAAAEKLAPVEPLPAKSRRCKACGEEKELNEKNYSRSESSKDGYLSKCRPCATARAKELFKKTQKDTVGYGIEPKPAVPPIYEKRFFRTAARLGPVTPIEQELSESDRYARKAQRKGKSHDPIIHSGEPPSLPIVGDTPPVTKLPAFAPEPVYEVAKPTPHPGQRDPADVAEDLERVLDDLPNSDQWRSIDLGSDASFWRTFERECKRTAEERDIACEWDRDGQELFVRAIPEPESDDESQ